MNEEGYQIEDLIKALRELTPDAYPEEEMMNIQFGSWSIVFVGKENRKVLPQLFHHRMDLFAAVLTAGSWAEMFRRMGSLQEWLNLRGYSVVISGETFLSRLVVKSMSLVGMLP